MSTMTDNIVQHAEFWAAPDPYSVTAQDLVNIVQGANCEFSATLTAARNAVSVLTPAGYTSIGDGLWKAQDQLDALPAGPGQIKTMVLLSDGEENVSYYRRDGL